MNRRALTCALAVLLTVSVFGCGREDKRADPEENTTAAETTASTAPASAEETQEENAARRKNKDGFGMLGYVRKSKKSSENSIAATLTRAMCCVLVDKEKKIAGDVVYSHSDGEDELNKNVRDTYFSPAEDIEYIMGTDESGYPKWLLCSKNTNKDRYVGVYGNIDNANELRDMKWPEVLKLYSFREKEYTGITLENDVQADQDVQTQRITLGDGTPIKYEGLDRLDLLALSIGMEYMVGVSQKPFCYYGRWGADEAFTADVPWEVPEHGDMEFIIELSGFEIGRVMCWETDTDKSLVGKYNFKGERQYLSGSSWDEVLEYFGYTQGEYVEYNMDERN